MDTLEPLDPTPDCPNCGGRLALVIVDGEELERCVDCGWLVIS